MHHPAAGLEYHELSFQHMWGRARALLGRELRLWAACREGDLPRRNVWRTVNGQDRCHHLKSLTIRVWMSRGSPMTIFLLC
jgi:hypothetical protein